jgi:hypothetical protein
VTIGAASGAFRETHAVIGACSQLYSATARLPRQRVTCFAGPAWGRGSPRSTGSLRKTAGRNCQDTAEARPGDCLVRADSSADNPTTEWARFGSRAGAAVCLVADASGDWFQIVGIVGVGKPGRWMAGVPLGQAGPSGSADLLAQTN